VDMIRRTFGSRELGVGSCGVVRDCCMRRVWSDAREFVVELRRSAKHEVLQKG
jgi:hypothetical protein